MSPCMYKEKESCSTTHAYLLRFTEWLGECDVFWWKPTPVNLVMNTLRLELSELLSFCAHVVMSGCSRCRNVYYCGRRCQWEHWHIHKQVCSAVLLPLPWLCALDCICHSQLVSCISLRLNSKMKALLWATMQRQPRHWPSVDKPLG